MSLFSKQALPHYETNEIHPQTKIFFSNSRLHKVKIFTFDVKDTDEVSCLYTIYIMREQSGRHRSLLLKFRVVVW